MKAFPKTRKLFTIVSNAPSFCRGLAFLASLNFCLASVMVPAPSVNPAAIADDDCSTSSVMSYVDRLTSRAEFDLVLRWTSFSCSGSGQIKCLERSVESPNRL